MHVQNGYISTWRHHHIPGPQFPTRHENLGYSQTFKADIGLFMFAWIFRTPWPKMGILWERGRGGATLTPNELKLVLTFGGYYRRTNFGEKR